jgi:ABC-type multidrug transport system fused ATPase/permease subunit
LDDLRGVIRIGGEDIAGVDTRELRAAITVVPQDAVVLPGTWRSNLLPEASFEDTPRLVASAPVVPDDHVLWDALERVDLAQHVRSLDRQLDSSIDHGGRNLSAGQRQLLCLARATLKRSRLILVDEATSNVDEAADEKLMSLLRTAFPEATVLIVAHRSGSIRSCDALIEIDGGKLIRYGPPMQ